MLKKIDVLVCFFLFFNFIGDSIGVFDLENEVKFLIIPFFFSNLTLALIMIKRLKKFKLSFFSVLSISIIAVFLMYLWYEIVTIFAFGEDYLQLKIGVYGLSLILISILVSYKIINQINSSNIFLLFCVTCILISDIFYVLYNFQAKIAMLDMIHFSSQVFSYLFFVKYIINKENLIFK